MISEFYWNYLLNQLTTNNADKQAVMDWLRISTNYEFNDEEIDEGRECNMAEEPLQYEPEMETNEFIDFGLTSRQPILQKRTVKKAFRTGVRIRRKDIYCR